MKCALRLTLALLIVAAGGLARAWSSDDDSGVTIDAVRQELYAYDPRLSLSAKVEPAARPKGETASQQALRKRYRVVFTSVHDVRVTAILALPNKAIKPMPAVVVLAGSGGHKDTDYVRIACDMLNTMGIAAISIDAQYHGERARPGRTGDFHFVQNATNRDAWVQTVIDLRRAVDYLCSRKDIDATRLAFLGFSQGAMVGGTLLGVEPRLRVACLVVGGGGLVAWGLQAGHIGRAEEPQLRVAAALTDPVYFIHRFSPRPLLMLAANRDELIPRSATEALYKAAGEPKKLLWYNSGHVLPPTALVKDTREFFATHLLSRSGR